MEIEEYEKWLDAAEEARAMAYAPYSHFAVGACLVGQNGVYYTGCNIENASSGACICAERTAVAKAVSAGVHAFAGIAIVGGEAGAKGDFCPPCGICRQVLSEFCADRMPVILRRGEEVVALTLGALLPLAFRLED